MRSTSDLHGTSPSTDSAQAILRHFPREVTEAFRRVRAGDFAAVDPVICAVVRDHMPNRAAARSAVLTDATSLIADLGYDSMAITEMVFFFEDLFQVSISNEDIVRVQTVGELRAFVRRKLAEPPPASPA